MSIAGYRDYEHFSRMVQQDNGKPKPYARDTNALLHDNAFFIDENGAARQNGEIVSGKNFADPFILGWDW